MNIGFLGFGEAASNIAAGFARQGGVTLYGYDVTLRSEGFRREILVQRLHDTGTTPLDTVEELLNRAEVIFLIIPAKFARDAALSALPHMTERHLFCDLTTNRPAVKEELEIE